MDGGRRGPAGATWLGDIGSALAMWSLKAGRDQNKREKYYTDYASDDDMLGDVDGTASILPPAGGDTAMGGNKLSDRLNWYYSGFGNRGGGVTMRYTNFCKASVFGWSGLRGTIGFYPCSVAQGRAGRPPLSVHAQVA